ncbi:MAG: rRNA pseudouridine synthase [Kiritimatiellae bacterium]|nr:rRNA pseudouridine synthase [Kiritimatiellia bacterium]
MDPDRDEVRLDGRRLRPEPHCHLLLNKPRGVLCTCRDPQGRPTVLDLLPRNIGVRLYTVGRLDWDSEGLLLLTNDGDLAARLIHPRHHVAKVYRVWTDRPLAPPWLHRFRTGIESEGEILRATRVRAIRTTPRGAEYEIELIEGRNRQIRRMVQRAGRRVARLLRIRIGPLTLGRLAPGRWRRLTAEELRALRRAAGLTAAEASESARGCSGRPPPAKAKFSCSTSPSTGCSP